MAQRSSGVRSTFAAPRFSSRRCSLVVPYKVQYIQSTGICDNGLVVNSPSQCPFAACSSAFLGKAISNAIYHRTLQGKVLFPVWSLAFTPNCFGRTA
jgi:hypothetical protein